MSALRKTTTTSKPVAIPAKKAKVVDLNPRPKAGDGLSPEQWVSQINGAWQRAGNSIVETGRLLSEAKHDMKPAEWKTVTSKLDVSPSLVSKLLRIGDCEAFQKKANASKLPVSLETLYILSALPDDILAKCFAKNNITSATVRSDAESLAASFMKKDAKAKAKAADNDDEDYDEEEADEGEEVDLNERPSNAPTPKSASTGYGREPKEEVTQYQAVVNNLDEGLESMLFYCENLEKVFEEEKRTKKLKSDTLKTITRLKNVLARLEKEYK